jgi:hypothetical protein
MKPLRPIVPRSVVTLTFPVAPEPTTAEILVSELTTNEETGMPPKLTAVAPLKFIPFISTVAPVAAVVGENDEISGPAMKIKPVSVAVPPGVATEIIPEFPNPTTAEIVLGSVTVNESARVPPKLTKDIPEKFWPVIVTVVPGPAESGLNEVITGGAK